jgi:Tfp pilus assembly protein PilV
MTCRVNNRLPRSLAQAAFTLIEVMIAITIFFMAMFSILGLLSASLHAASILRNNSPSASMVAGQLSLTNKLFEGSDAGDFGEVGEYKNFRWVSETREVATNGLYQVDFTVLNNGRLDSTLSIMLYRPDSQNKNHLGLH